MPRDVEAFLCLHLPPATSGRRCDKSNVSRCCTPAADSGPCAGRFVCSLLVPDAPPVSRTGKTAIITPGFIILTTVTRIACAVQSPGSEPLAEVYLVKASPFRERVALRRAAIPAAASSVGAFTRTDPPARRAFSLTLPPRLSTTQRGNDRRAHTASLSPHLLLFLLS